MKADEANGISDRGIGIAERKEIEREDALKISGDWPFYGFELTFETILLLPPTMIYNPFSHDILIYVLDILHTRTLKSNVHKILMELRKLAPHSATSNGLRSDMIVALRSTILYF